MPIRISVRIQGVDATTARFRRLVRCIEDGLPRVLADTAKAAVPIYQGHIQSRAPVRTGRLRRSLRFSSQRNKILLRAIFYAAPVNARTRFIDRAVDSARPEVIKLLRGRVIRHINRCIRAF